MKFLLGSAVTLTLALAVAASLASAPAQAQPPPGQTKWFDRDNPSGVGDYEDTVNLLRIRCRLKGDHTPIADGSPAGYHCKMPTGGWCKNSETAGGNDCKDMEVSFSWPGGNTGWFDRDDPSGVGDYEDTVNLLKIRCELTPAAGGGQITDGNPVGYHCSMPVGGYCKNSETVAPNTPCKDMRVQFYWP